MLWKRWDTPPGETYSSGFEEEYKRTLARRSQTGESEIWLAFEKIDQDQLQDPGEQLKRVIAFRQTQEASRTVLFKEFLDGDNWEKQLRTWLQNYIGELIKKEREALSQPSPNEVIPSPAASAEPQETFENIQSSELPTQLTEAISELHRGVMNGDLQSYTQTLESLPRASVTRLFLTLKATITARFSAEALSGHEINLLYRDKNSIDPLPAETILFLRTVLVDQHSLKTGWYWFRNVNDDVMFKGVLHAIEREFTLDEQVNALALLVDLGIPLPEDDSLARLLETTEKSILRPLVRWIGAVGASRHLSVLDAIERRSNAMSAAVFDAKTFITVREEPERALQFIIR
ncbi:MAG: hypothetical protein AB7P69_07265 [Candidatus Binatia bacterium]